MDGPFYRCDYLGFTAISKPPTGVNALQPHLKDLYLKYRKVGGGGRAASLKLIQQGIFITLLQEGKVSDELFFNFEAVNFIEAVRFAVVKSSSEKKPKAIFIPVDESKGPISDKHSFSLDKSFHFLTSIAHPPLVACVVRRPVGVKALDCHLFALESVENALHITSLVGSAQTPPGYESRIGQGFDSRGFENRPSSIEVDARGDGNFNRGLRGDIVRPEYSDYSFYRGAPAPNMGHGMPNEMMGGNRLPPTNIQRIPAGGIYHQGGPAIEETMVYGLYEQPRSGALMAGPIPRSAVNNLKSDHSPVVLRHHQDVPSASRHSGGFHQPGPSPRYSGGQNHAQTQHPHLHQHPQHQPTPTTSQAPPLFPTQQTPLANVSPRRGDDSPDFGQVYSASNRENRDREQVVPQQEETAAEQYTGGKPVAKVPPHLRGIKVLPTDFRNVKLKPRMDKRSESLGSHDEQYDNNNDIMQKYLAMQESSSVEADESRDSFKISSNGGMKGENGGWRSGNDSEESVLRHDYRQKQESARHPNRFSAPVYADSNPVSAHWTPNGRGHQPSQSAYNMGVSEDPSSTKDAEIANMFSNMGFERDNSRGVHNRFDIEDGLGYLP